MIIADELGAAELDQTSDGFADDNRTEVANVHLLSGVRRGVVNDDLPATHDAGRTSAPLRFVAILAQPGPEGLGRQLEVDEARTSHLDLNQGFVELARRLNRVHQGGRQSPWVSFGFLGGGDGAVALEVRMTWVGRT